MSGHNRTLRSTVTFHPDESQFTEPESQQPIEVVQKEVPVTREDDDDAEIPATQPNPVDKDERPKGTDPGGNSQPDAGAVSQNEGVARL